MADSRAPVDRWTPLPVWGITLLVCGLLLAAVTAYDYYYNQHNKYIARISDTISKFKPESDKPLVVLMGASLEMAATDRDWTEQKFNWLRLIIQGSTIDDFNPVTEQIIELKPDLVILGLHLLKPASFVEKTRRTLKQLVRIPLEHQGFITRRNQFETRGCTGSVWEMHRAVDRMERVFDNMHNSLTSSSFLKQVRAAGIPVIIVHTPLVMELQDQVTDRNLWMDLAREDARNENIDIHETGWVLDTSYFCSDLLHMNGKGRERYMAWLKPIILQSLEAKP